MVLEDRRYRITEASDARVCAVEGELTAAAPVGDSFGYIDAEALGKLYSVEWTEDEIEFYRGRRMSEREVLQAFGLKRLLVAMEKKETVHKRHAQFAACCLALALLSFLGWAIPLG